MLETNVRDIPKHLRTHELKRISRNGKINVTLSVVISINLNPRFHESMNLGRIRGGNLESVNLYIKVAWRDSQIQDGRHKFNLDSWIRGFVDSSNHGFIFIEMTTLSGS